MAIDAGERKESTREIGEDAILFDRIIKVYRSDREVNGPESYELFPQLRGARMWYRKILVCLDMHDQGTVLFDEALDVAAKLGSEMMLFCCIGQETLAEAEDRVATVSELEMIDSQRAHDRQRDDRLTHVRAWLQSLAKRAEERGVPVGADAEEGNPPQRICELARRWEADLIVLGHSSRHPLRELLIGNTNIRVLRDAPCAVLVTKRK